MELDGSTHDLLIFLGVAGIIVPLFARVKVGIVLGFLVAGVILGPGGLGGEAAPGSWLAAVTFANEEQVGPFAELGILFLLFTIGLELSVERLWAMRRLVFGAGTAQMLTTTAVIAVAAVLVATERPAAVVIGMALAFSSTAIVLQLIGQRRLGSDIGRTALGILLLQDLMVVPGVILVTILSGDEVSVSLAILRGIGVSVAAVAVIVVAGRFLLRPLLVLAASTGSREIVVAIALFLAIGAGAATTAAGLSAALGAFLAGLLLGSSEYRHQVEVDIEPFKGLLLGVFFMSVGMGLDLAFLVAQIGWVLLATAGLLLVKGGIVFAVIRAFRLKKELAIEMAFLMAGAGEFAFALFTLARQEGLLAGDQDRFLTTVAVLSMIATPALAAIGKVLAEKARRREEAANDVPQAAEELSGHVVICGFGRVGEMVARSLEAVGIAYVALDLDGAKVRAAKSAGRPVHFGDGSRVEMLQRLGGERAIGFVVTADLPALSERTVSAIRLTWPEAPVFARSRDPVQARRLRELGALEVVPETLEASIQLAGRVLMGLGLSEEETRPVTDQLRVEGT